MKSNTPEETLLKAIRQWEKDVKVEQLLAYLHSQGMTDISLAKVKEDYEKVAEAASNAVAVSTNPENEWLKLGYNVKQSKELAKLSGCDLINAIKSFGIVTDPANE